MRWHTSSTACRRTPCHSACGVTEAGEAGEARSDGQRAHAESCFVENHREVLRRPCLSRKRRHLSGHGGQLLLLRVLHGRRDPLRLGVVSLHGGLLSGIGRFADLSGPRLPPQRPDPGVSLLSSGCMASVPADRSYGRYDRADGADELRVFLSGVFYLPVRALHLLHDDGIGSKPCEIQESRQLDPLCRFSLPKMATRF